MRICMGWFFWSRNLEFTAIIKMNLTYLVPVCVFLLLWRFQWFSSTELPHNTGREGGSPQLPLGHEIPNSNGRKSFKIRSTAKFLSESLSPKSAVDMPCSIRLRFFPNSSCKRRLYGRKSQNELVRWLEASPLRNRQIAHLLRTREGSGQLTLSTHSKALPTGSKLPTSSPGPSKLSDRLVSNKGSTCGEGLGVCAKCQVTAALP